MDWKSYYDSWLCSGDSTLLLYLVHREQYSTTLEKSSQEYRNLQSQIETVLQQYNIYPGAKRSALRTPLQGPKTDLYCDYLLSTISDDMQIQIGKAFLNTELLPGLLQLLDESDALIASKPMQKIHKSYWTHPVWILWCYLYDRVLMENECYILVCYRYLFYSYMYRYDYQSAAKVYMYSCDPQYSLTSLQLQSLLLSPEVIRANMKINIPGTAKAQEVQESIYAYTNRDIDK